MPSKQSLGPVGAIHEFPRKMLKKSKLRMKKNPRPSFRRIASFKSNPVLGLPNLDRQQRCSTEIFLNYFFRK